MFSWNAFVYQFLGEYTTQTVIQTDNVVQILCCTFVFALPLKKKPKYPLRVVLTMLCYLLFERPAWLSGQGTPIC